MRTTFPACIEAVLDGPMPPSNAPAFDAVVPGMDSERGMDDTTDLSPSHEHRDNERGAIWPQARWISVTDDLDRDIVFDRVQTCLATLVGGSGHLASYHLRREPFEITGRRELDDGFTAYEFAVDGIRVSEFTGPDDDSTVERLTGRVVLDADDFLALDDDGRVRIEPWRVLDPTFWPDRGADGIDELLSEFEFDSDSA